MSVAFLHRAETAAFIAPMGQRHERASCAAGGCGPPEGARSDAAAGELVIAEISDGFGPRQARNVAMAYLGNSRMEPHGAAFSGAGGI